MFIKGGGTCPANGKTETWHTVGILYMIYRKIVKISNFCSFNPGKFKSAKKSHSLSHNCDFDHFWTVFGHKVYIMYKNAGKLYNACGKMISYHIENVMRNRNMAIFFFIKNDFYVAMTPNWRQFGHFPPFCV